MLLPNIVQARGNVMCRVKHKGNVIMKLNIILYHVVQFNNQVLDYINFKAREFLAPQVRFF